MSKLGINLKIDVTKIDKAKLYKGAKGTYLDATVFVDPDNPSEYGDHGMISQATSKEEREAGQKGARLGNVKVFWTDGGSPPAQQKAPAQSAPAADNFDDDIPF